MLPAPVAEILVGLLNHMLPTGSYSLTSANHGGYIVSEKTS